MMRRKKIVHQDLVPTVAIGKNGVTDQIIEEIKKQIKNRRTIKVKLHGESRLSRLDIAHEIAKRSNTKLIDVRGFTVVLTRKKRSSE